jgi:hypothetical protein
VGWVRLIWEQDQLTLPCRHLTLRRAGRLCCVLASAIRFWIMLARVLMAFLGVFLVGCGKPAAPSAATSPPDQAQIDAVVNDLTHAVRKYAVEQRRAPKALDELVANGYLARLPSAPAGKKFAIDKNLQVYLANQ